MVIGSELITEYRLKADSQLGCWQNAIVNATALLTAAAEPARMVFVTDGYLRHVYLVQGSAVFNSQVTWEDSTYRDFDLDQLMRLHQEGKAVDITNTCLRSQFLFLTEGVCDEYWEPVPDLCERLGAPKADVIAHIGNFLHSERNADIFNGSSSHSALA